MLAAMKPRGAKRIITDGTVDKATEAEPLEARGNQTMIPTITVGGVTKEGPLAMGRLGLPQVRRGEAGNKTDAPIPASRRGKAADNVAGERLVGPLSPAGPAGGW